MKITWSLPVYGERLDSSRGDLVRARCLIEALRGDGHEVRVVEDAARPGSRLAVTTYRDVVRRIVPTRAAVALRDVGRWLHSRGHGRRVAAQARQQGADLIIETQVHFSASGALAARLTGLPLILDDCSPPSEEIVLGAGLPGLAHRIFQAQIQNASKLVVPSQALRKWLIEEGAPSEKLAVVPNGTALAPYSMLDRERVRRRLGVDGQCVFGFLGSFQPWHRVEFLIQAVASLVGHLPVHVLLIGDGSGRPAALTAVRRLRLDRVVTWIGSIPYSQVQELVSAFDVGVLPGSNDYCHPMKLVDYAAAGLPCVAPDLPSVREVVRDGVTGLLFPPDDVNELAAALTRLATKEDLRMQMGESARQRFAQGASWKDRARTLVSAIASTTHDKGSA